MTCDTQFSLITRLTRNINPDNIVGHLAHKNMNNGR